MYDSRLQELALQAGATVPFMRSAKNADDYATIADVVEEVLDSYAAQGQKFDRLCCLLPTAPFITAQRLQESAERLNQGFDSAFPVVEFSYPIQRALQMDDSQRLSMVQPEHARTRSQDLPSRYYDAGQFYWATTSAFREHQSLLTPNCSAIVLPEIEVQDIDTPGDWQMAEWKYRFLQGEFQV